MSGKMQCPICGKSVEASEVEILDNGNPACAKCVAEEKAKLNKEEK